MACIKSGSAHLHLENMCLWAEFLSFPPFCDSFPSAQNEIFLKLLLITSVVQKPFSVAKIACTDTGIKYASLLRR